jgi:hypothetical protein
MSLIPHSRSDLVSEQAGLTKGEGGSLRHLRTLPPVQVSRKYEYFLHIFRVVSLGKNPNEVHYLY